jgi:hypothetical protein
VILTILVIVVLVGSLVAWLVKRWWVTRGTEPATRTTGPKHRWWQP